MNEEQTHLGRIEVRDMGSVLVTSKVSGMTGEKYLVVSVESDEGWEIMTTTHGQPQLLIVKKRG